MNKVTFFSKLNKKMWNVKWMCHQQKFCESSSSKWKFEVVKNLKPEVWISKIENMTNFI